MVEPGVMLLDIYEAVEKEGLFYAPDPGEKTATIGGTYRRMLVECVRLNTESLETGIRGLVGIPNGKIERKIWWESSQKFNRV